MPVNANSNPSVRPGVRLPVVALAVIALVVLLGFFAYQTFTPKVYAPPVPPPRSNSNEDAFRSWAKQRYHETGGKWSKLSPEDQQRFVSASRGKGQPFFESFKP